MITLFSTLKPFRGHIEIIQRNAIRSWLCLDPVCEIILLGDDYGTAEVAAELGVQHIPDVVRNEYGTPLLNALFQSAERFGKYPLLCYVNADIMLMNDFIAAVRCVHTMSPFLMVGQRWDVELQQAWDFDGPNWQSRLRDYVVAFGVLHPPTGLDYFVYPRGTWGHLPPFAIGRTVWDNWLVHRARSRGAALIDATRMVMAIHQNHDYAHFPHGKYGGWNGPEAMRNRELSGTDVQNLLLWYATHILTPAGVKPARTRDHLQRYLVTLPVLYPRLDWFLHPTRSVNKLMRRIFR